MIALFWDDDEGAGDVRWTDGELVIDGYDLQTAVFASLFTDRYDDTRDVGDRRGWWGTEFDADDNDEWGSLLWTLDDQLATEDSRRKAEVYATESLQWLIDDGIAETVTATAVYDKTIPGLVRRNLRVEVQRPGELAPRLVGVWEF